uniref:Secreted protein n=1 Tax=Knipowitschia caucasica TaxID=637954 RepID=A0AAV2MEQ3_KNICA
MKSLVLLSLLVSAVAGKMARLKFVVHGKRKLSMGLQQFLPLIPANFIPVSSPSDITITCFSGTFRLLLMYSAINSSRGGKRGGGEEERGGVNFIFIHEPSLCSPTYAHGTRTTRGVQSQTRRDWVQHHGQLLGARTRVAPG